MKERIKEIYCYPGYYASTKGNIYSKRSGKLTKIQQIEKRGYLFCRVVNKKGKRRYKGVHRLVALAFVPGRKKGLEVNHKNKNRKDNRPSNLEWITHRENVRYSRSLPLTVITKSGHELYYSCISDFERQVGWCSGRVQQYRRMYNSYCKKLGLTFVFSN